MRKRSGPILTWKFILIRDERKKKLQSDVIQRKMNNKKTHHKQSNQTKISAFFFY